MERDEAVGAYLDNQISRRVFIRKLTTAGVSLASALAYADLLVPTSASAATVAAPFYADQVWVYDYYFLPSVEHARQGDLVPWSFYGSIPHTVTDSTGMRLFNSGYQAAGSHFVYGFDAAGAYQYKCADPSHVPMNAVVRVPVKVRPLQGPPGTTFTVTWSTVAAPAGFVFDVQISRPGQAFQNWVTGTTARRKTLSPTNLGRYRFRARLRKLSNNNATGYSPAVEFKVA